MPVEADRAGDVFDRRGPMAAAGCLGVGATLTTPQPSFAEEDRAAFHVLKHGAKGDGKAKDTRAIQAAIESASRIGSSITKYGVVVIMRC